MSMLGRGTPFHGEFSSADASALSEANSRFRLYPAGGDDTITLASTQQVVVTDIFLLTGNTALTVSIYDGGDNNVGAGEVLVAGDFGANGGVNETAHIPHYCQEGTYPKVKTSGAGQINASIRGVIID